MERITPRPDKFKPAGKRILVLPDDFGNKSAGGLMLPEEKVERPQTGTVIQIGPDVLLYKNDDRILFGKSAGVKVDFEDIDAAEKDQTKVYWLMQESEIFGTIE